MSLPTRMFVVSLVRGATALSYGALAAPAIACYLACDLLEAAAKSVVALGTVLEIKLGDHRR